MLIALYQMAAAAFEQGRQAQAEADVTLSGEAPSIDDYVESNDGQGTDPGEQNRVIKLGVHVPCSAPDCNTMQRYHLRSPWVEDGNMLRESIPPLSEGEVLMVYEPRGWHPDASSPRVVRSDELFLYHPPCGERALAARHSDRATVYRCHLQYTSNPN